MLENDPFHESAPEAKQWLTIWMVEVTDIQVTVCTHFLDDLATVEERHGNDLFMRSIYSAFAYAIENPTQMSDEVSKQLAGLRGAIQAYKNVIKLKPEYRWSILDQYMQLDSDGTLEKYVRDEIHNCVEPDGAA